MIDTYNEFRELDGGGSHDLITTVEEAVRMGVDAVKMIFPWNMSRFALLKAPMLSWNSPSPRQGIISGKIPALNGPIWRGHVRCFVSLPR